MSDRRDLIIRWQRGWGVARALPAAEDVGGGLRVRCMQPGRDVEYVALDAGEDLASLTTLAELVAGEDSVTWLTVPTTEPAEAAEALEAAGLIVLKRSELLMTADLRRHPQNIPAAPYRLLTEVDSYQGDSVVTATVRHESGEVGARGATPGAFDVPGLTKARHASGPKVSTDPDTSLLSRTPTMPGTSSATSTPTSARSGLRLRRW
ncbi:hypothetical protein BDK92_5616 [Micromonospora pisi]|uniref:Uncharacterized protein n=1 Tax=Micromonospora pisi TaxID=589240 RepID=A0A495JQH4_9ACTN|nr:hypothetical protein BDK92_5616 [Micromonospora pisi]